MKILTVFGTRPELIKLAPVMFEAKKHDDIELTICSTGQHREMLDQALNTFGLMPDIELAVMQKDQTLSSLTARLMQGLDGVMQSVKPDAVLVQGDATSAFVGALAAFYHHIPVGHVEAGLRTGDLENPFPEEASRLMIARLAHWNFPPTAKAAQNLAAEGIAKSRILISGNTVIDAINWVRHRWDGKQPPSGPWDGKDIVLVTTHRRESFGEPLRNICAALKTLCARHPELHFIFPVHMNPNVRGAVFAELQNIANLHLIDPVDYETTLYLQSKARLILTDSGGIQEEAPTFATPCVVMREQTERSEGISAGFAALTGTNTDAIVKAAETFLTDTTLKQKLSAKPNPYGDGKASQRIIATLRNQPIEPFNG